MSTRTPAATLRRKVVYQLAAVEDARFSISMARLLLVLGALVIAAASVFGSVSYDTDGDYSYADGFTSYNYSYSYSCSFGHDLSLGFSYDNSERDHREFKATKLAFETAENTHFTKQAAA